MGFGFQSGFKTAFFLLILTFAGASQAAISLNSLEADDFVPQMHERCAQLLTASARQSLLDGQAQRRETIREKAGHFETRADGKRTWVSGADALYGDRIAVEVDTEFDTFVYSPKTLATPDEAEAVVIVGHGCGADYSCALSMANVMNELGRAPYSKTERDEVIWQVDKPVRRVHGDPKNLEARAQSPYLRLAVFGFDLPLHGAGPIEIETWLPSEPKGAAGARTFDFQKALGHATQFTAGMIRKLSARYPGKPVVLLYRSASPVLAEELSRVAPDVFQAAVLINPVLPDVGVVAHAFRALHDQQAAGRIALNLPGLLWANASLLARAGAWTESFFGTKPVRLYTGAKDWEMSQYEREVFQKIAAAHPGRVLYRDVADAPHDIFRAKDREVEAVLREIYALIRSLK